MFFLDKDLKSFEGVEIIAAVKISFQNDVESLVSRYEKNFKADRQLGEDNVEFEIYIAENGTLLMHADGILKNTMDKYWSNPILKLANGIL